MQIDHSLIDVQSDDQLSCQSQNTSQIIQLQKYISVRNLKLHHFAINQIPYDCIVVVMNQRVISSIEEINQINMNELQILDVRTMFSDLMQTQQNNKNITLELKNQNEKILILINEMEQQKEKMLKQNEQLREYEIQVSELKRDSTNLNSLIEYNANQQNQLISKLQDQVKQQTLLIQNSNVQLSEKESVLQQQSQQNQENTLKITNYAQHFEQINQESYENVEQQFCQGLITHQNNEQIQMYFNINETIQKLKYQNEELLEKTSKNKEQEENIQKLQSQNQILEIEVQSFQSTLINEQKIKARLLQYIDNLKRKLNTSVEQLIQEVFELNQLSQQKEQLNLQLTSQIKEYSQKISLQEAQLLKLDNDYKDLNIQFKKQQDEYKFITQLSVIEGIDVRTIHTQLQESKQLVNELKQAIEKHIFEKAQLNQNIKSYEQQIQQKQIDLDELKRINLKEIDLKTEYKNNNDWLQNSITQLNHQISEAQLLINQFQQKIQEDSQTIDNYNQYLSKLNQECQQNYGYQYSYGLLSFYKNEFEQFSLQANLQIEILTKDKAEQEETIIKNKTESDKKYKKLLTEKQNLEVEVQNLYEIIEKNQKKSNLQLQEINELKRKLKQAEEDLSQQIEAQGQNQEQQIQNLNEQNRQLIKQKGALEAEIFALKQSEKDYQDLYGKETQKFKEQKKANDANETQILQLTDQLKKLQADLKKSEVIRQQIEFKLDFQVKQNAINQKQSQQQLNESIEQIKTLKADINKLNEQIASQNKQIKELQYKLADTEDLKYQAEQRIQDQNQQIQIYRTQIKSLELEKQSLNSQLSNISSDFQNSRRELEYIQQLSDKTIQNYQLENDQLQTQIDQLQEKITWLIPRLSKNQHNPKILSLVETIRISFPVLEDFVKNEQVSFDDSAFIVYRINPVENLLKEVLEGRLLKDQKILELQELGKITAKRSINPTTENSDYFRGFMLKVTHGIGELIDRLFVIRENKSGLLNFLTVEEAVESAHNQFLAEYIFQQFNLFLHSKGRQQSDLKFPATYIFKKKGQKGEKKFYLSEEIQEGPFEKYLGGELVIRNDNDDAKFSNALALFSYYKSKKSMMLSNLQTLNRVYHDTIVCTITGQLTNYDQGLDEIHLIINQLRAKGDKFIDPFIVREDEF